ncbi:MAG: hypothetical protein K2X38_12595 [Gemmataceae bacterium]|nr:hypothetical protein [Gemmataceae bacterium]
MSEPASNSPVPLPPPSPEELARRLKTNLAKERPRSTQYALVALAVVVGALSALAWYLRPQPEPGRWTVVAFDDWALAGETAARRARLEPLSADDPPSSSRGHELFFRGVNDPETAFVKVAADAHGEASAPSKAGDGDGFAALYLGAQRKYKAEDRARHFRLAPQTRLLAVDIDETVADLPSEGWGTRNPQSIAPNRSAIDGLASLAKQGVQVVYLSRRIATAKDYQRVRSWTEQNRTAGLPEGPVLGMIAAEKESPAAAGQRLLVDLRKRWPGPLFLAVGSEDGATAGKASGITTYLLGDAAPPQGVFGAKSWPELAAELAKGQR